MIVIGLVALAAILMLGGLLALAIAYPFALIAKAADDRIARAITVNRRLGG